jgi:putative tryptophan/tyrosine transport system substrate-binding protein
MLSPELGARSMQRREFITLLGGVAAAWPLAAQAQQPSMPVIGSLSSLAPGPAAHQVVAFRQGLSEIGFTEGVNVVIEYRWADGQYDRLPAMAADLAGRRVAVIVASGGEPAALAAKAATSTIPIVFVIGGDPVKVGLVASLNRPGANITGVTLLTNSIEAKRLGLLRELVPNATTLAMLVNPTFPTAETQVSDAQVAARTFGQQIHVLNVSNERDFDAVFASLAQLRADALLVSSDPFLNSRRDQIVARVAQQALPAIYEWREFAAAGGLMSYGTSLSATYRQVGVYTGRVLKGEKPSDMPVIQPTKFELVINLKTAKTLGLTLPSGVLSIADEVIE